MESKSEINDLEESPSMNHKEAIAFLREQGIQLLSIKDWKPGEPILYVLSDEFQDFYYSNLPKSERPVIARIDNPITLSLSGAASNNIAIENKKGQIAYYVINSKTNQIKLLKTSAKAKIYIAERDSLFTSDDRLFPKAKERK